MWYNEIEPADLDEFALVETQWVETWTISIGGTVMVLPVGNPGVAHCRLVLTRSCAEQVRMEDPRYIVTRGVHYPTSCRAVVGRQTSRRRRYYSKHNPE